MNRIQIGFWNRFLATWIDGLIIYITLKAFFYLSLASPFTIYFPFEFTFFIAYLSYSSIMIGWKEQTIGKWLLNIKVAFNVDSKLNFPKLVLREFIFKPISGIVFFWGFIWIVFDKQKRGWHDVLTGTEVVEANTPHQISSYARYTAGLLFFTMSASYFWGVYTIWRHADYEKISHPIEYPFLKRNDSLALEISSLNSIKDTLYGSWVQNNGTSPKDYLVNVASTHQITLLGEMHDQAENLNFLNCVIPDLYYHAGVRVICLECLPYTLNSKINKLIKGETFNRDFQLEIARNGPWSAWGGEGYWRILETAWKLNKTIKDDNSKIKVFGLDEEWNGSNIAMVLKGDDGIKSPITEKFRVFTFAKDLQKLFLRDQLMTYHLEKEVIEEKIKSVVLAGFAHTMTNFAIPIVKSDKVIVKEPRFGVLLKQKYKDDVFQIGFYSSLKKSDKSCMNDFLEKVMQPFDEKGVAFSMADSPLKKLRDKESGYFDLYPSIILEDLFEGFIYLGPLNKLHKCNWTKDFISKRMFIQNKAFYNIKLNQEFMNENEMNYYMDQYCRK